MQFRPWVWTFQLAWPAPAALALVLIALGWLVVATVFMGLSSLGGDDLLEAVVFSAGVFGGVPALGLITVGVLFAGSWAARTGLLGLGTCVGVLISLGMGAAGAGGDTGVIVILGSVGALPALVFGLATLGALVFAWGEVRAGLAEQRLLFVDRILDRRGFAWKDRLAWAAATSEVALESWLPEVDGVVDPDGPLVWRPSYRARKADELLAMVTSQGRVHRADLAAELQLRSDVLPLLLGHVVRDGRLSGFVDWEEGVVTVVDLPETDRCPRCAGETELVGARVVQCRHCDAEVFARPAP